MRAEKAEHPTSPALKAERQLGAVYLVSLSTNQDIII
jgi:hypothetical protein